MDSAVLIARRGNFEQLHYDTKLSLTNNAEISELTRERVVCFQIAFAHAWKGKKSKLVFYWLLSILINIHSQSRLLLHPHSVRSFVVITSLGLINFRSDSFDRRRNMDKFLKKTSKNADNQGTVKEPDTGEKKQSGPKSKQLKQTSVAQRSWRDSWRNDSSGKPRTWLVFEPENKTMYCQVCRNASQCLPQIVSEGSVP